MDEASRAILAAGEGAPSETTDKRAIFLQPRTWTKAILSSKTIVSSDTRIFSFTLDHPDQVIGLPIGQHLMIRLRDPVTREAIIRSYTPISEGTEKGILNVLVKIYFDTKERAGGKMTQALDAIPIGHFADFKGPIGKFEYRGRGRCVVGGQERLVKRFIMICAGSGVTPIFQVLRAVLSDPSDPTKCLVLDSNRHEEDILCKEEIDHLAERSRDRCKLLYALTQPEDGWTGIKGRIGKELLEKEVGESVAKDGEDMVLICGPEPLEKSVHEILNSLGWMDKDLLFF